MALACSKVVAVPEGGTGTPMDFKWSAKFLPVFRQLNGLYGTA